jgi:hypothetical protein
MSEKREEHELVDRVLAEYFESERPKVWPRIDPTATTRNTGKLDSSGASRLALALSLALILGLGFWSTTGMFTPVSPTPQSPVLTGATADGKNLLEKSKLPTGSIGKETRIQPKEMP